MPLKPLVKFRDKQTGQVYTFDHEPTPDELDQAATKGPEPDTFMGGAMQSLGDTASRTGSGIVTGLNPLTGAASALHALFNPRETVSNLASTVAHPVRTIQALSDPETGGEAIGNLLLGGITGRVLPKVPAMTQSVGRGVEALGTATQPISKYAAVEAAMRGDPWGAVVAATPYAAKYGGRGMQAAGRGMEALKNYLTPAAEGSKVADPLVEESIGNKVLRGPAPKGAPKVVPTPAEAQSFQDTVRGSLGKSLDKTPGAADKLGDLDEAIGAEQQAAGKTRAANFREEAGNLRGEQQADITNLREQVASHAKQLKEAKKAAEDAAAAQMIEDAKASGMEPRPPTVQETVSAPITGGKQSMTTKYAVPKVSDVPDDLDELGNMLGARGEINPPPAGPARDIYDAWINKGVTPARAIKNAAEGRMVPQGAPVSPAGMGGVPNPPVAAPVEPVAPPAGNAWSSDPFKRSRPIAATPAIEPPTTLDPYTPPENPVVARYNRRFGSQPAPVAEPIDSGVLDDAPVNPLSAGKSLSPSFEAAPEEGALAKFFKTRTGATGANYGAAKTAVKTGDIPSADLARAAHMRELEAAKSASGAPPNPSVPQPRSITPAASGGAESPAPSVGVTDDDPLAALHDDLRSSVEFMEDRGHPVTPDKYEQLRKLIFEQWPGVKWNP